LRLRPGAFANSAKKSNTVIQVMGESRKASILDRMKNITAQRYILIHNRSAGDIPAAATDPKILEGLRYKFKPRATIWIIDLKKNSTELKHFSFYNISQKVDV